MYTKNNIWEKILRNKGNDQSTLYKKVREGLNNSGIGCTMKIEETNF